MKITVIIENQSKDELDHEHGLSLFIEYKDRRYLLDAGSSDMYLENAKKLGVDLSSVDMAVLSHGHYDHSGGFGTFVDINKTAPIFIRKHATEGNYKKSLCVKKYIGVPKKVIEKARERFVYIDEDIEITPNVFLIGHHTEHLEERGKKMGMYYDKGNQLIPDDFRHEQSLVFDTENGLIILNSCSHAGVDNIIKEVKKIFPEKKVRAMIGGFHLMGALGTATMRDSKEEVEVLGKRLLNLEVQDVYTCHCTGIPAYNVLKDIMGETLHEIHTGDVIEF